MERLTMRIESQNRVIMNDFMPANVCDGCSHKQDCSRCSFYGLLDRLAAYEDLGTAEELAEMVNAKRAGRCVVLPCKVGDTVFRIIEPTEDCSWKPFLVVETVEEFGVPYKNLMGFISLLAIDDFGKTVFLTCEEAEAKLKEV